MINKKGQFVPQSSEDQSTTTTLGDLEASIDSNLEALKAVKKRVEERAEFKIGLENIEHQILELMHTQRNLPLAHFILSFQDEGKEDLLALITPQDIYEFFYNHDPEVIEAGLTWEKEEEPEDDEDWEEEDDEEEEENHSTDNKGISLTTVRDFCRKLPSEGMDTYGIRKALKVTTKKQKTSLSNHLNNLKREGFLLREGETRHAIWKLEQE